MRSYRRGPLIAAGTIVPHGRDDAPPGWLPCDGRAVSRAAYPRLFAAIGTAYGAGDGATTFGLPDLTDRAPVGAGSRGRGTAFGVASRTPVVSVTVTNTTLTQAQMPSHGGHLGSGAAVSAGSSRGGNSAGGSGAHAHGANATAQAMDMHQPSIACNFIIKF